jgi:hypothetical protein
MKPFEFGDGQSASGSLWDVVHNGRHSVWNREDLFNAIRAFCTFHTDVPETVRSKRAEDVVGVLYRCCRVTRPEQVPSYAFGAVIGTLTQAMVGARPNKIQQPTLRLPARKDNA